MVRGYTRNGRCAMTRAAAAGQPRARSLRETVGRAPRRGCGPRCRWGPGNPQPTWQRAAPLRWSGGGPARTVRRSAENPLDCGQMPRFCHISAPRSPGFLPSITTLRVPAEGCRSGCRAGEKAAARREQGDGQEPGPARIQEAGAAPGTRHQGGPFRSAETRPHQGVHRLGHDLRRSARGDGVSAAPSRTVSRRCAACARTGPARRHAARPTPAIASPSRGVAV